MNRDPIRLIYRYPYRFYLLLIFLGLLAYLAGKSLMVDLQARDGRGRTALYLAAEQGDLDAVKRLINKGAVIDARDNCSWTPMMRAAQNGHLPVVRELLAAGAELNAQDKEGYNALILSVITGQQLVVEYLLEQGIKRDVQDDKLGWTALMWAAKEGRVELVDLLLDNGADKTIRTVSGKTAYDLAIENKRTELAERLK
ncbi:MAG: ankyrin repeat domain-containing protein [Pseudomonadota bacterium]|nr:ankyrin repeat domain-containing protein [Pseudomonadota bacterium]